MTTLSDEARTVLSAGLAWLYDTTQPDDAIPDHHGYGIRVGDRRYRFIGEGANGLPVVVVSVAEPAYDKTHIDWPLLNPIGGELEMEALASALTDLGWAVREWWNGSAESGSVGLVQPLLCNWDHAVAHSLADVLETAAGRSERMAGLGQPDVLEVSVVELAKALLRSFGHTCGDEPDEPCSPCALRVLAPEDAP